MALYRWRVHHIDQIVLVEVFDCEVAIATTGEVRPLNELPHSGWRRSQVHFLFLLCVEKRVPKQQFLALQIGIVLMNVVPVDGHGAYVACSEPLLILAQLPDERHADLKVRTPRIQKLQRLDHRPVVPAHDVRGENTGGTTLATYRVHKHALLALGRRVDKVVDLIRHSVLRVEQDLILLVNPVECQVSDADALPHVAHRVASAVDNVCDFVGHDEFQVLHKMAEYCLVFNPI